MKGIRKFSVTDHIFVKSDKYNEFIQVGFLIISYTSCIHVLPEKNRQGKEVYYSIEEIAENQGYLVDRSNRDEIFFVMCSNLQAWVENEYNTDLYIFYMAFPILKELVHLEIEKSKFYLNREVFRKMTGNYFLVKWYPIKHKYLKHLDSTQVKEFLDNHYKQFLIELANNSTLDDLKKFELKFELLSQCHSRLKSVASLELLSEIVKEGFNTGDYETFFYLMEEGLFYDPDCYFTKEEHVWSFFMDVNSQFFENLIGSLGLVVNYDGIYPIEHEAEAVKLVSNDLLESLKIKTVRDGLNLQYFLKELKKQDKNLCDIKETYGVEISKTNNYYRWILEKRW